MTRMTPFFTTSTNRSDALTCVLNAPLLIFPHLNRLKARHGSGPRRKPSQQVSASGSQQDITAFFRIIRCYWLHLKLQSDCSIQSLLLKSAAPPYTPHSVQCKDLFSNTGFFHNHGLHRTDADTSIYIDSDTKIQVFDSMNFLPRAEKEQCAAFIVCRRLSRSV
jgi:hypothetical protein